MDAKEFYINPALKYMKNLFSQQRLNKIFLKNKVFPALPYGRAFFLAYNSEALNAQISFWMHTATITHAVPIQTI